MNDENSEIPESTPTETNSQEPVAATTVPQEQPIASQTKETEVILKNDVNLWLSRMGWRENPFTFTIMPSVFVGYRDQITRIMMAIEEKHKVMMILGPTGSGKTTLLKWINDNLDNDFRSVFIPKPPENTAEIVELFNSMFRRSIINRLFTRKIKSIYEIPEFIHKKLGRKHLVLMFDEAHESDVDILEWLRVLCDQTENVSIIISGLPVFEEKIRDKLETLRKRVSAKIELLSLTKEETAELVRRRIMSVNGKGTEFDSVIDFIYEKTAGFPREVLRLCDEFVNEAISRGTLLIGKSLIEKEIKLDENLSTAVIDNMTPMQRDIIELLAKQSMTPGQIVDSLSIEKYKSRQHAVRSANNIMKALYEDGYLERRKSDKAFVYALSGRLKTVVVKA
jgi:type II secretory pathway predicted ATPase ExeA